jgi:hypothetical protein
MGFYEHKRCLGCGYDLHGLPENRCPECGRGFDPAHPSTFASGQREPGWGYLVVAVAVGGTALAFGAINLKRAGDLWLIEAPLLALPLKIYVFARSIVELRRPVALQPYRASWRLALFFSDLASLGLRVFVDGTLSYFMWELSHLDVSGLFT